MLEIRCTNILPEGNKFPDEELSPYDGPYLNKSPLTPAHVKRGLTELEIKFEISRDLGREELREYDAKKKN